MYLYVCPNTNPSLGPVKDNQQAVSVYDNKLGNIRTVITTPDEADQFIKDRSAVINHAEKSGLALGGLTTIAGTGIGAGINYLSGIKHNKEAEALTKEFLEHLATLPKKPYSVYVEAMDFLKSKNLDTFKHSFEETANAFKKVKLKNKLLNGAIAGSLISACLGLMIPLAKISNADAKITQEFIEHNK